MVVNLINLELSHLLHRINVDNERMIVRIPVVLYWILMEEWYLLDLCHDNVEVVVVLLEYGEIQ